MSTSNEYQESLDFESFLDQEKGERGISEKLLNAPQILYWTLSRGGGHDRYVFREFPLGSRFKVDFVVLNSYSGSWQVTFIELEPVGCRPFTKAGVPSARLSGALKQIEDWADYFSTHKEQVRSDLVLWAKQRDILGYSDRSEPCNFSGQFLADSSTYLSDHYTIFVGRRTMLEANEQKRKSRYTQRYNVEVASYDRMLDLVRDRYKNKDPWLKDV